MNLRLLLALPFVVALPAQMIACSDDTADTDTTTNTNTTDTSTDTTSDTTTTDTTVADTDQDTTRPDITTPEGSVKKLQADAVEAGCDPTGRVTINPAVNVTDVVVTAPKYDAFTPDTPGGTALDGYYVADQDGGLYSGITLIVDRALESNYLPGDVLTIDGQLEESFCNTQLRATTITMGTSIAPPTPIVVDPALLADEAYEGMLVKIEDVEVTEAVGGGSYKVTGGMLVSHDGFDFFLSLDVGSTYTFTGMVKWSFNEWRLIPRTEGDIILQGGGAETAITAIQGSADSVTCANPDGFTNGAEGITVTGVLTTNKYVASSSSNLDGYFLSDGTTDDFSGIAVTISGAQATNFMAGDTVTVVGNHVEFFCQTQLSASSMQKTGTGTPPAAVVIASDIIAADLEKYEGMTVELNDVTIGDDNGFGDAPINGRSDLLFDWKIVSGDLPANGTVLSTLRGQVAFGFGAYRVQPRSAADVVVAE